MRNFYEAFIQGQATLEVMENFNPAFEVVEKSVAKLTKPIGLSIMIMVHPVAATLAEGVKSLFVNQAPTVRALAIENSVDANILSITEPAGEETRSSPFQGQKPKPSYIPGLSTLTATTSGDTIQLYGYYSTVERSLQKISAPDWIHEASSLPNQPVPAFYGAKTV